MDNPVFEMDDEFFEREIMAPRRRLWERGGGTLHGVCEYLRRHRAERLARQATGEGLQTTGAGLRAPSGKESDLARKGAEGE